MTPHDDVAISVTAAWNDWRSASVRLSDIRDPHWLQRAGAPHTLLHGFVSCAAVIGGQLSHVREGRSAPHRLRVCCLQRRNAPAAYAELARRVNRERAPLTAGLMLREPSGSTNSPKRD